MGRIRARRAASDDTGFVGYSRSNAGTYHERMVLHRSRGRILAVVAVALAALMTLACVVVALGR